MTQSFPTDWNRAVVFVAHPDDPEYGMSAAVSRWVREGKRVEYVLATSGEAGIQGMPPDECGPLREEEQRRAAAHVGVDVVDFLGFPDSRLENTAELRVAVRSEIESRKPDLIVTLFTGPRFSPEIPNQSDHIEFGNAVLAAAEESAHEAGWVFESGPEPTHVVYVEDVDVENAVASLAEHRVYLAVLDPDTPVLEQARAQVDRMTMAGRGPRRVGFIEKRRGGGA
jgi:LmbE family N-acetylglucosaminyl deacetylase